jgi:hypothetical protein
MKLVRSTIRLLCAGALVTLALPAGASHNLDEHSANMSFLFNSPNGRSAARINSDLAFWGKYAYQGDYGGFRIFDVSNPASPSLVGNMECFGPQNDITVFDRDGNGQADILFTSTDNVMTGPGCDATQKPLAEWEDPGGWEGIRIFDISNPAAPTKIGDIYQDCGSHTHTLWPDPSQNRVLLYNSSYPLRPGPTCGPNTGPPAGKDPLHGVIQIVQVSWSPTNPLGPVTATEIAEPPVNYPGDPDNKFDPEEHGIPAALGLNDLRACHDISVYVTLRLAAAACAEQAQLWRVNANGIPDTQNPIWTYDDTVDETGITGDVNDSGVIVDFWHSATFTWDGRFVHFEDESLPGQVSAAGECPPTTDPPATQTGDSGRMFLFNTQSGSLVSTYMNPTPWETDYCSAHLGNFVPATDKYLLIFAWYMGGITVLDFANPAAPTRVAHYDAAGPTGPAGNDGFENWAAYWYEGPSLPEPSLTIYGTDGVSDASTADGGARGFLALKADIDSNEINLTHLNPQTQDFVLGPGGVLSCKGKIATLVGTDQNDTLVGTIGNDVIAGLGGNDKIKAAGGKDRVCGNKGKDRLKGRGGNDRLFGQGGNDKLNGGGGRDRCVGGGGRDKARKCEKEKSIP